MMTKTGRTMVAALVFAGAGSIGIALAASGPEAPPPGPDVLDRRMAVEKIQSFSDFVGFESHFALGEPDDVLVMTGGELCGPDVLAMLPVDVTELARGAGFRRLTCSGAHGERADVEVPR